MTFLSPTSRLTLVFTALTLLSLIVILILLWRAAKDPQGGQGLWCDNEKFTPVSSASGWIASGHNTVCSGFGGSSAIYIYVRPFGQEERREFLVFRYFEHGGEMPPKIEWVGEYKLSIRLDHIPQITKKISSIGPVNISYHIRKEDYPESK